MRIKHIALVVVIVVVVTGIGLAFHQPKQESQEVSQVASSSYLPPATSISDSGASQGILPDPELTPGAVNPNITQANISQNICNPHWSTKSIRPPVSYTNKLKAQQIKQYGYSDTNMGDYEEDHLIPLEIGGNSTSEKNLWPESYLTTPNARDKDKVENYLHAQVCAGKIKLQIAQQCISRNWTECMF